MLNGRIGQVSGPFTANVDLLDDNAPIGGSSITAYTRVVSCARSCQLAGIGGLSVG